MLTSPSPPASISGRYATDAFLSPCESPRAALEDPCARPALAGYVGQCCYAFGRRGLTLDFDVRRVKSGGQWTVSVTKRPPGAELKRAQVDFEARTITMFDTDLAPHKAFRVSWDVGRPKFLVPPHEFGHTINARDDRSLRDPLFSDRDSLMNIGTELRAHHFWFIAYTLGKMVPGCGFNTVLLRR